MPVEMEQQQQASHMQSMTDQVGQLASAPIMDPSKNPGLTELQEEQTPPPEE